MRKSSISKCGFTLVELLIAMSVGLVVLATAVSLYTSAVNASWQVSQNAELQQDSRAAFDLLTQDISLAGAGMPSGGFALASGGAAAPNFGCDVTSGTCHLGASNNAAINFPTQTGNAAINYLYGVVPGCGLGPTINGSGPSDTITVDYSDSVLLLSDYQVQFNNANGTSITFVLPNPAPNPQDQAVNNTAVGLQKGDLVLFNYQSTYALAEVTAAVPAGAGPYTVSFADPDLMKVNQTAATSNSLKQLVAACVAGLNCTIGAPPAGKQVGATATRIFVISYYIDKTGTSPRLMRQVSAQAPVPVADNIQNLNFTYATYDASGNYSGAPVCAPPDPSQIRNINLTHLTLRSQAIAGKSGYQGMDMQTSVSARNLSFTERYSSITN
ncbi:MAG TPA: prepilin-type N-terminal cleavage/methylation domain-containing protein [Terriglobales bacterium]|jgi:prepilin-type N-terminal cleavage/methylation domain-containing protein